jgi:hypothetical protein
MTPKMSKRRNVTIALITSDPTQPTRLLKNKNIYVISPAEE